MNPQQVIRRTSEFVSLDEIRAKTVSKPSDIVVVGGSIIEGMGNYYSDVDVCVVTDSPPKISELKNFSHYVVAISDPGKALRERLKFGTDARAGLIDQQLEITNSYELLDNEGTRCDVEYLAISEVRSMVRKIREDYEFAGRMHGGLGEVLPLSKMKFLHRLLSGIVLSGSDLLTEILGPDLGRKTSYLLFRSSLFSHADFQDIAGSYYAKRWDQTVILTRAYLNMHLKALTHIFGNTNPSEKWVPTYSERIFGAESKIHKTYRRLHRETPVTDETAENYVLECMDFCDSLYKIFVEKIDDSPEIYPTSNNLNLLRQRVTAGKVTDPHLFAAMEYHSKPFNLAAPATRVFLEKSHGINKFSFVQN